MIIETLRQIALGKIFGLPTIVYGGVSTLLLFAFTAYIGYSNYHGKRIIPFKWHPRLVVISFIFALIHATLGLSIFL